MDDQKLIVYHGCRAQNVPDIRKKICLGVVNNNDTDSGSDFCSRKEPRAFYTTENEDHARIWAEKVCEDHPKELPAVIKFEFNLNDLEVRVLKVGELKVPELNVHDFGKQTNGESFKAWQKVELSVAYFWKSADRHHRSLSLTTTKQTYFIVTSMWLLDTCPMLTKRITRRNGGKIQMVSLRTGWRK